ncbi:MAG: TIM barrel protein [Actinobacteria bacterium]|nr:TIM barrel protein [Actinomycetota bacterium]
MIKYSFNVNYWFFNDHMNLDMHEALDEISITGWQGVELSGEQLEVYYDDFDYFDKLIKLHNLEVSSYYTWLNLLNENFKYCDIEKAKRKCEFLSKLGCNILLLNGGDRDKLKSDKAHYKLAVKNINKIGQLAKSFGMKCTWHQHWGSMFETAEEFKFLMENTDPDLIGFCPDTAQLHISKIDPVAIIEEYKDRINYIHFKDLLPSNFIINRKNVVDNLKRVARDSDRGFEIFKYFADRFLDSGAYHTNSEYRFVEVGRGIIKFEEICKILKKRNYDGWIVVDQDYYEVSIRESLIVNLNNIKYFMSL